MSEVSAVIPHYNRSALLDSALSSLHRQSARPVEIIVVDNGSTDDSQHVSARQGARWLPLGSNFGFARAVNEGARAAAAEWIFVMNNDVVLEPGCLERLLRAARQHDAAFAVPRLVSAQDNSRLDSTYDLLCRGGCASRAGYGEVDGPAWQAERTVRFAPFTAVLLHRDTFLTQGGLDERFESYLEDVDFSLRLALSGRSGVYVPEASGQHQGSATFGAWSGRVVRLMSRNQALLVLLHFPRGLRRKWRRQIYVAQVLWGMLALRHGRFLSWLEGKREARRLVRTLPLPSGDAHAVERILSESERQLKSHSRASTYWRLYFLLAGDGE